MATSFLISRRGFPLIPAEPRVVHANTWSGAGHRPRDTKLGAMSSKRDTTREQIKDTAMASTSSGTALALSRARAPDETLRARTERAGRSGAVGAAPTDDMPAAALSRGRALPALDPQQLVASPWTQAACGREGRRRRPLRWSSNRSCHYAHRSSHRAPRLARGETDRRDLGGGWGL